LAEIKHTDKPEPGEIAEVLASTEEAEKPGAIWYTDEEAQEELIQLIASRRAARKQAKPKAS